jgi:hypothetical protein
LTLSINAWPQLLFQKQMSPVKPLVTFLPRLVTAAGSLTGNVVVLPCLLLMVTVTVSLAGSEKVCEPVMVRVLRMLPLLLIVPVEVVPSPQAMTATADAVLAKY